MRRKNLSLTLLALASTTIVAVAVLAGDRGGTPAGGGGGASAGPLIVDFETLAPGTTSGTPLDCYLAGFGISIGSVSAGFVGVFDDTLTYGGGVVDAPSGTQYLAHAPGVAGSNSFTLNFSTPLISFGFAAPAILVPSINASWTATAFDAGSNILDQVSFSPGATHPTTLFTLNGPGIVSVTWNESAPSNAAFFGANLDDFVLAPVPACPADINGDGLVNSEDLTLLLGAWAAGGCP